MTTQHELIGSRPAGREDPILRETSLVIADPQVPHRHARRQRRRGDPGNDMPAVMLCSARVIG
jgi:carbon-monoxide dehydrogenase medium subunit